MTSAEKLYPDPGMTVIIRTDRDSFEALDGREARVVSWDGHRGTVYLRIPATAGERARGEFDRRVEVARSEVEDLTQAG